MATIVFFVCLALFGVTELLLSMSAWLLSVLPERPFAKSKTIKCITIEISTYKMIRVHKSTYNNKMFVNLFIKGAQLLSAAMGPQEHVSVWTIYNLFSQIGHRNTESTPSSME